MIGDFDPGWSSNFLDDVIDCLDPFTYWATHSKGDWSVVDPSSALNYGWDNFTLYRVRACSDDEVFESFESMGVPPIGIASGGRMNPAGISYFYLAREKKTAKKEVLFKETSYYLGTFKNISPLKLINFADLPSALV